jgi:hypothetical protein
MQGADTTLQQQQDEAVPTEAENYQFADHVTHLKGLLGRDSQYNRPLSHNTI